MDTKDKWMYLTINFKSNKSVHLSISKHFIILKFLDIHYAAQYTNLKIGFDLRDVPIMYYYLMIYILFYNLEEIEDFPQFSKHPSINSIPLVSYSGGVDSTAVLYLTKGIPVHITRNFNPDYENRQIRACKEVDAIEIITGFELIRKQYDGKHGFNTGTGYISMYFPLLYLLNTNTMVMGTILEGIAFYYGNPFRYNTVSEFKKSDALKIQNFLARYNIYIDQPLAGCSEVISTQLAAVSGINNYSSCHTVGSENFCRNCYKCFRKFGFNGTQINYSSKIIQVLKTKPVKAAVSAVYAIQKANYRGDVFDRFYDIDVSFAERCDMDTMQLFSKYKLIPMVKPMTAEDKININKFVDFINNDLLYK